MLGTYLITSAVSIYCIQYIQAKRVAPNKVVVAASAALFILVTVVCPNLIHISQPAEF